MTKAKQKESEALSSGEPAVLSEKSEQVHSSHHGGSGAFGWFRRWQKPIIWTAGIFTLLVFSITGALTDSVRDWFAPPYPVPTITLPGGEQVNVTEEDNTKARGIRMIMRGGIIDGQFLAPLSVMPNLGAGDSNRDLTTRIAALRRMAIELGIDASADDAEKAIEVAVQTLSILGEDGLRKVAGIHGFHDLGNFRDSVREALRVGTFLRMVMMPVGEDFQAVLDQVLESRKQISLAVAVLDKESLEKGFAKAANSKKELQAFLEEMEKGADAKFRDANNHVQADFLALEYKKFNAEQFTEELADFVPEEEALQAHYDNNKGRLYRKPVEPVKEGDKPVVPAKVGEEPGEPVKKGEEESEEPGENGQEQEPPQDPFIPFAEVKPEIVKIMQANKVLQVWLGKLDAEMALHMQEVVDVRTKQEAALAQALNAQSKAAAELAAGGDMETLQAALTAAESAVEEQQQLKDTAAEAVTETRSSFRLTQVMQDWGKGKDGFSVASSEKLQPASDLQDLPGELGEWLNHHVLRSSLAGEYLPKEQANNDYAFLVQVTDMKERPYKDWAADEALHEELKQAYLIAKADTKAEEMQEAFLEVLDRRAGEQRKTEVTALEEERAAKVADDLKLWQDGLNKDIVNFEGKLSGLDQNSRVYKKITAQLQKNRELLADETSKLEALQKRYETEYEDLIKAELKEGYKDVLEAAAGEAGFQFEKLGPFAQDLAQSPRFGVIYKEQKSVLYLYANVDVMALEDEATTEVLEDFTNRRLYMTVCTGHEDGKMEDLTRRQWMKVANGEQRGAPFTGTQRLKAVQDSFTMEAMKAAYGWTEPASDEPVIGPEGKKEAEDEPKGGK